MSSRHQIIACVVFIHVLFFTRQCLSVVDFVIIIISVLCIELRACNML